ncbi:MAG: nucleotide-diphospho-sugar transferase [Acidobacteriota bacterium]|nr:MAG: nucleotide-diphospho-sugar transferase [Acidobacteriota bacterium]
MGLNVPVLFMIFNRLDTAQAVFSQIQKVKPRQLFIAADGPREHHTGEAVLCQSVQNYILNSIDWDCDVHSLIRQSNLGCGRAVSEAINWFFSLVDEGIILEDDTLPSNSFFEYCEYILSKYRTHTDVMHVSGSNPVYPFININESYYFSRIPHSWGWATWRRAWSEYRYDLNTVDDGLIVSNVRRVFKNTIVQSYWAKEFINVKRGDIDTWDYQWFYRLCELNAYCVTPAVNMIRNIGFTQDATHTLTTPVWYKHVELSGLESIKYNPTKEINVNADNIFMNKYIDIPPTIFHRILRLFKRQFIDKNNELS